MGQRCMVTGAMLRCSFGIAPATMSPLPVTRVTVEGRPVAVTSDTMPIVNIGMFGPCQSLANPATAAATTAAAGVLTPMPCTPVITGQWVSTSPRTTVGGRPVLTEGAMCMCAYGGVVTVTNPGSVRTTAS